MRIGAAVTSGVIPFAAFPAFGRVVGHLGEVNCLTRSLQAEKKAMQGGALGQALGEGGKPR